MSIQITVSCVQKINVNLDTDAEFLFCPYVTQFHDNRKLIKIFFSFRLNQPLNLQFIFNADDLSYFMKFFGGMAQLHRLKNSLHSIEIIIT